MASLVLSYRFGRYLSEMPRRASRPEPSREFRGRVGRFNWLMDHSQVWPGRSAKHLRWSSAALCSSEPPVWSRFRTTRRFPDQRGSNDGMRDGPEPRPDDGSDDKRGRIAVKQDILLPPIPRRASERAQRRRRRARVAEHPPTPRRRTQKLENIVRRPRTASRAIPNS